MCFGPSKLEFTFLLKKDNSIPFFLNKFKVFYESILCLFICYYVLIYKRLINYLFDYEIL